MQNLRARETILEVNGDQIPTKKIWKVFFFFKETQKIYNIWKMICGNIEETSRTINCVKSSPILYS